MTTMENILILFLWASFVPVKAWVGIIRADPATAHLGDCYATENNLGAFTVGEEKRIEGECAIATCESNGDIRLTGCGVVVVDPPYRVIPGDLSKPFPDCCYEIVGPTNETDATRADCNLDPRNSIFTAASLQNKII